LEEQLRRNIAVGDEQRKLLENENGPLKRIVADLLLDEEGLQDVLRRKL
jgi:hypothetical protein